MTVPLNVLDGAGGKHEFGGGLDATQPDSFIIKSQFDAAIGGITGVPTLVPGEVVFGGAGGAMDQDADLFWDNGAKLLVVGSTVLISGDGVQVGTGGAYSLITSDGIVIPNGSAGAPSLAAVADTDTGLFFAQSPEALLSIGVAGAQRVGVYSSRVVIPVSVGIGGDPFTSGYTNDNGDASTSRSIFVVTPTGIRDHVSIITGGANTLISGEGMAGVRFMMSGFNPITPGSTGATYDHVSIDGALVSNAGAEANFDRVSSLYVVAPSISGDFDAYGESKTYSIFVLGPGTNVGAVGIFGVALRVALTPSGTAALTVDPGNFGFDPQFGVFGSLTGQHVITGSLTGATAAVLGQVVAMLNNFGFCIDFTTA